MSDALASPKGRSGVELERVAGSAASRGWACTTLKLDDDGSFKVFFQRVESTDWIEVAVCPKGLPGKVFRELQHCAVRYRGSLSTPDELRRTEVLALVTSVAGAVEARLAASPGTSIPDVLGRRRESGRFVFSRDMLRALLAPELVEGVPVVDGWVLTDVYPSSYAREHLSGTLELVLDFLQPGDQRRALIVVSKRLDKPCFAQTRNFSLSYLAFTPGGRDGAEALRAFVAFTFELRDHEGLEVVFPEPASDVAPALLPSAASQGAASPAASWLNLAINADCRQQCSFCSIKQLSRADDGGEALFARLAADLSASRQRGVDGLRVNGYDPLAYSRIAELLGFALQLGYARAHVFSPCTLLADRTFCEAILEALPAERCFFVPLYAARPEHHDLIVGRAGAHALVMQALDNLLQLAGEKSIAILSVVTRGHLEDCTELAEFADLRGFSFSAHMPYPSAESQTDSYFSTVPKQTEVAEVFASAMSQGRCRGRFRVNGVAPCVVLRGMARAGVRAKQWFDVPRQRPLLPGTEYRDPSFTHGAGRREAAAFVSTSVPCPHVDSCALSLACPGEILRSYVELCGIDEFRAVSLRELIDTV